MYNNDDQSGNWVSGITVKDVEYRDQYNPPYSDYIYDSFVKKASFMWIRITWQDESLNQYPVIYHHADVMSDMYGQFVLTQTGQQFYEGNRVQGGDKQTTYSAEYGIDVDDDDYGDFVINESMTLNFWMVTGGAIELRFWLMDYPTNWVVGDYTIISMEFAYYVDIDIDNYDDNEVLFYNNDSSEWEGQDVEVGPVTVPYENGGQGQAADYKPCVEVNNGNHKAVLDPQHNDAKPSWAYYYVVNNHNNEYSQDPSNYVNDEGLDAYGADPAIWCIIGYDISANNFPPTTDVNGEAMEINIVGFTA